MPMMTMMMMTMIIILMMVVVEADVVYDDDAVDVEVEVCDNKDGVNNDNGMYDGDGGV